MNLNLFLTKGLYEASMQFFKKELGINISPASVTNLPAKTLLGDYLKGKDSDLLSEIKEAYLIGKVDDDSLQNKKEAVIELDKEAAKDSSSYSGVIIFAIRTKSDFLSRNAIAKITRALNRRAKDKPVILLTLTGKLLNYSTAERSAYKQNWREGERIGKISMLKDIDLNNPHRGHIKILWELKINPLLVLSYNDLHNYWQKTFSIQLLNKQFYEDLFHWYLWAKKLIKIPPKPKDEKQDDETLTSIFTIRLLTRLLFVWFVKEKGLINNDIFTVSFLKGLLNNFEPGCEDEGIYYKAILQNLFFATLNTPMTKDAKNSDEKRQFFDPDKRKAGRADDQYLDQTKYRHDKLFNKPEDILKVFKDVPFLNGGLFECLDLREGTTEKRYDGFSSKPSKQPLVPDVLFFGKDTDLDLSADFDNDKKMKHVGVRGIIDILSSYKFTITENTPLEEEIALDPELLGKVFENLLASYNPETHITARKQTGSFYTPREIVSYMVDESLMAYLLQRLVDREQGFVEFGKKQSDMFGNQSRKGQLKMESTLKPEIEEATLKAFEDKLKELFDYGIDSNPFTPKETKRLIEAISDCKILDPACGSGAFPMGVLHRMVHILSKLDPNNASWKTEQLKKANRDKETAQSMQDEEIRRHAILSAEQRIKYIEESFGNPHHELDYTRKLFLIENCIYGVDIQQIAVQIAKLRFFISLMAEQRTDNDRPNRNMLSMPNLETKFVAANTLIGLEKNVSGKKGTVMSGFFESPKVKRIELDLKSLRQRIFYTRRYTEKKKLKQQEKQLREDLKAALLDSGFAEKSAIQAASWDPFDSIHSASFYDTENMFAFNEGFSIVIGNPPYIQLQKDGGSLADSFKDSGYETYDRMGDIYSLFYERGWQLLKSTGVLCYITSKNWMRAGYGERTRKFLAEKTNPLLLIDFAGQNIFEAATVNTNILLFTKSQNEGKTRSCLVKEKVLDNLSVFVRQQASISNFSSSDSWTILSPIENNIKAKIETQGVQLRDWDITIYRGILTGYNDAFIIDGKKKDELIAIEPKSAEIIRPILRGRDIKKFNYEFADIWLINTHNGIKEKGIKPIKIEDYPAIKKHLDCYYSDLEKRTDKGDTLYNLRNCAYMEDFFRPKIVWKRVGSVIKFSYDDQKIFALDSTCFAIGKDIKFLVAVLNSKMGKYLLKDSPQTGTGDLLISVQAIEPLKVPIPNVEILKSVEQRVDRIVKNIANKIQVKQLEEEINKIIYKLYHLSIEEIEFIESQ